MAQRLAAAVLALVFGCAPVAAQVCELVCAEHAGHAGVAAHLSHDHHLQHVHVQAGVRASVKANGALRECTRVDAVVTESRQADRGQATSAVVTASYVTPLSTGVLHASAVGSRHKPPIPQRSISPLRI